MTRCQAAVLFNPFSQTLSARSRFVSFRDPPTIDSAWRSDLQELATAEDFLEFFAVEYEEPTVHVNRLHILQRFHQYLAADASIDTGSPTDQWNAYRKWLVRPSGLRPIGCTNREGFPGLSTTRRVP